jgi:hypothetical protein
MMAQRIKLFVALLVAGLLRGNQGAEACQNAETWTGLWKAGGTTGAMDLDLSTDNGNLQGTGTDSVGPFTIAGTIDHKTIQFTKSYSSSANGPYIVNYDGDWVDGTYTGQYVIPETDQLERSTGGFDLTPPSKCMDMIPQAPTALPTVAPTVVDCAAGQTVEVNGDTIEVAFLADKGRRQVTCARGQLGGVLVECDAASLVVVSHTCQAACPARTRRLIV